MSAAFNIGSIARDVSLPTFAIAALRTAGQVRFSYSRPRSDTVAGELLTRIDFRERGRPTLVSGAGGRDVPLEGTVWLAVRDEELVSRITVVFGPDAQVGVWVPVDMRERYDNSWGEVTTGHARYSNYRRFRTSGRLVRPGA